MAVHASSPRGGGGANTAYGKLHDGLDHALALLLSGDESLPAALAAPRTTSPYDAWLGVRSIAAERQQHVASKRTKLKAKWKASDQRDDESLSAKPVAKVKREEPPRDKVKTDSAPVVKMLDLSGSNLSPVMTHAKAPSRKNGAVSSNGNNPMAADALPSLKHTSAGSPRPDMLSRLRRLPLLEALDPTSTKYRRIVEWLESDDAKNQPMVADVSALINKLQKNGVVLPTNGGNGKAKRPLDLSSETLNDLLKKEKKSKTKNGNTAKGRVKKEPKRRKTVVTPGRKRKLGGFVVESDEAEYEDGSSEQDSEAEYESGDDASSSGGEVDYEVDSDPVPVVTESETDPGKERIQPERSVNRASAVSPRSATPPTSTKASPNSTPREPNQGAVTGKEQLATVVSRLRQLDQPTYLSYGEPAADVAIKEEASSAAPSTKSTKVPLALDGSSETNAIVLDDSDDDDDDHESQTAVSPSLTTSTVTSVPPKPSRPAKSASPKAPPKPQRVAPPKHSKSASSVTVKSTGKGKAAASASVKRKNAIESEEDSDPDGEGEAEFVAAGEDENSSTEGEEDMFDLNEEDVFVVESILEVKKGRTLLTNSGRYTKDPDLFLVKWEGYDELTWEPEANIPKRIINFFNEREKAKLQCNYQIDKFLQRKVAKNTTTGRDEVLYLIQWKGLPQAYWEVKATMPEKVRIWLEKASRASLSKANGSGPSPRKKTKS